MRNQVVRAAALQVRLNVPVTTNIRDYAVKNTYSTYSRNKTHLHSPASSRQTMMGMGGHGKAAMIMALISRSPSAWAGDLQSCCLLLVKDPVSVAITIVIFPSFSSSCTGQPKVHVPSSIVWDSEFVHGEQFVEELSSSLGHC
jgi:hypothetical protein